MEKAIAGIMKCRETIHKEHLWSDPLNLSDVMTKLAVYNSYLSDEIAPAHKQATDKAYAVFNECRSKATGVTESERIAQGESTEAREYYERIRAVYTSTASLISVLQSRLKVIENSRKQEGI